MGNRKYPPLKPKQIENILYARGFILHKKKGDHRYYVREVRGKKRIPQIDWGIDMYNSNWIKTIIKQSGMTREQFYCSTKKTARKIGLGCADKKELANWATV